MGLSGVLMLNAFAWRSTDPNGLLDTDNPVGDENTVPNFARWIEEAGAERAVAAWGNNIERLGFLRREEELKQLPLSYFRMTKPGHPEHPLYLPSELRPEPWFPKTKREPAS